MESWQPIDVVEPLAAVVVPEEDVDIEEDCWRACECL